MLSRSQLEQRFIQTYWTILALIGLQASALFILLYVDYPIIELIALEALSPDAISWMIYISFYLISFAVLFLLVKNIIRLDLVIRKRYLIRYRLKRKNIR